MLGPVWIRLVHPASYWRLAYLVPLPWMAGLAAGCLRLLDVPLRRAVLRLGALALGVFLTGVSYEMPAVSERGGIGWKRPSEYKLPPNEVELVDRLGSQLDGRRLLAPVHLAMTAGLVNPRVQLYADYQLFTAHLFANAGCGAEGTERVEAQRFVTLGEVSPRAAEAFRRALARGVDAVAVRDPQRLPVLHYLREDRMFVWREACHANGYFVFLRDRVGRHR